MAKKKERASFVCPQWNEVANRSQTIGEVGRIGLAIGQGKQLTAIKNGRPVARSTLRKALTAFRRTSGAMFDGDAYIVDQRTIKSA